MALTIEKLKNEHHLTDDQLNRKLSDCDLFYIADFFSSWSQYVETPGLGLSRGEKAQISENPSLVTNTLRMKEALKIWRSLNPYTATFRKLLSILLSLNKQGDVVQDVCLYLSSNPHNIVPDTLSRPPLGQDMNGFTNNGDHQVRSSSASSGTDDTWPSDSDSDETSTTVPSLPDKRYVRFKCGCGTCSLTKYIAGKNHCLNSELTSEPPQFKVWIPEHPDNVTAADTNYLVFLGALQTKYREIHSAFISLLFNTFILLKENGVALTEVKTFIKALFRPPGNKYYCQIYKKSIDGKLREVKTFEDLRTYLHKNYCSWYNYEIIEELRKEFLFNDVEEDNKMNKYEERCKYFVNRRCFLYLNDVGPNPGDQTQVICKVEIDFQELHPKQIKKMQLLVMGYLDMPKYSITLKQVREGCTELVFRAPACLEELKELTPHQIQELSDNKFLEITIGGRPLFKEGKTALRWAKEARYPNPDVLHLLEKAVRNTAVTREKTPQEPPTMSVPVLPENWEVVTSKERNEQFYRNTKTNEEKDPPPSGYPLLQNPSYPNVTFFDDPQEKVLSSSGGHVDFDNGVEITVPPRAVPLGTTVSVKVQPSFAPKDVFVMPQGIHSASPSYLITSGSKLDGDVTLTLEHHVTVSTDDDANDLLFLQADTTPQTSDSASVYEYKEIPEARTEFLPGETTGRLTTRRLPDKFVKVGRRIKEWFNRVMSSGASNDDPPEPATPKIPPPDPNLYTVRAYSSSPQTSGDRITILTVSLCGQVYAKFLEKLDNIVIPRDYPAVSSEAVDRTIFESLSLVELNARLTVVSAPGWRVDPNRKTISKREVDHPETCNFKPEELHDYPPRIVCRFYPEDHTPPKTTCTLSFTGFDEEVKINVPLKAPKPQRQVDTRILQEAADKLRTTTIQVKETQLVPTVETILSLMEMITTALCSSSSLRVLAAHTDSIKVEVQTVLSVSRKVAEECSIRSIKDDVVDSLSNIEALSHQLCLVTKVKLKHCQDPSEETAALNDLVSSGANLMNTIDRLLNYTNTLNEVTMSNIGYNVLVQCGEKIVRELTKDPKALAVQLHSKKYISDRTLAKTIELEEIKHDKATRIHGTVLEIVRHHPRRYGEFISILEDNGTLYRDLLKELQITYNKLSMPKLKCFDGL